MTDLKPLIEMVERQAEDEGLWFVAQTAAKLICNKNYASYIMLLKPQ